MMKQTPLQWAANLALYETLNTRIEATDWFCEGWQTEFRFVDLDSPRVIFLLSKPRWCSGHIYFKTRLTNTDLIRKTVRVGLHVETSLPADGINRVIFDRVLLDRGDELIRSWERYVIKPTHYQKPLHVSIPFTPETLVSRLFEEFTRLQSLAPIIRVVSQ
jgi:hypothetical protein